uniref:Uncharacterized protein n=1 Tax=Chromera velia CCMP2878 TaxID=1169474 RepID=A0A0G4H705_9ALVE|eukprot:Cvel_24952.t1-p1 / transcript=Cvel_24952.t1 / gene=Cvel_24952 / organism=Chromera_velia_CCMP2878 / gene_product=hypothetical protein / transcript_product=hypothetical protein / location=Cvel_scaffold2762:11177-15187(+) / protein_length=668 / sequence_SO=supercontig / SO=protein_coding / is_pseudo=false
MGIGGFPLLSLLHLIPCEGASLLGAGVRAEAWKAGTLLPPGALLQPLEGPSDLVHPRGVRGRGALWDSPQTAGVPEYHVPGFHQRAHTPEPSLLQREGNSSQPQLRILGAGPEALAFSQKGMQKLTYEELKPPGLTDQQKVTLKDVIHDIFATTDDQEGLVELDEDILQGVNAILLPVVKAAAVICVEAKKQTSRKEYKTLLDVDLVAGATEQGDPIRKWKRKDTGAEVNVEEIRVMMPDGSFTLEPMEVINRAETEEEFEERRLELFRDAQWVLSKLQAEIDYDALRMRRKTALLVDIYNSRHISEDSKEDQIMSLSFNRQKLPEVFQTWVGQTNPTDVGNIQRRKDLRIAIQKSQEKTAQKLADIADERERERQQQAAAIASSSGSGTPFVPPPSEQQKEIQRQRDALIREQQAKVQQIEQEYMTRLQALGPSTATTSSSTSSQGTAGAPSTQMTMGTSVPAYHYAGNQLGLNTATQASSDRIDSYEPEQERVLFEESFLNTLFEDVKETAKNAVAERSMMDIGIFKTQQAAFKAQKRLQAAKRLFKKKGEAVIALLFDHGLTGLTPDHRSVGSVASAAAARDEDALVLDEIKENASLCLRSRMSYVGFESKAENAIEALQVTINKLAADSATPRDEFYSQLQRTKDEMQAIYQIRTIVRQEVLGY